MQLNYFSSRPSFGLQIDGFFNLGYSDEGLKTGLKQGVEPNLNREPVKTAFFR